MGFSGTVAIRAMKDGDYQATVYPGTTAGLQAAIDSLAGGKGIVHIGPGELRLTGPIALASGLTLRGSGAAATTLKWPDSYSSANNDALLGATSAKSGVTIEGMTLDGNRTNISTSNALFGIRMIDPSLLTIRNVRLTEHHNGGVRLLNSAASITDCLIEDCIVDGYGTASLYSTLGITVESSSNSVTNQRNLVRNCVVRDATVAANCRGIVMESNYSRVVGCTVQNLATSPDSDDCAAICLNKCTGSQVTGCSVDTVYGIAYSCQNGRLAGGDTTFVNQSNSFTGNSAITCRFGVESSGCSNFTFSGNSIRAGVAKVAGGAAEGIEINDDGVVSGTLENIVVSGNTVDVAMGNAIWIGSGSSGAATLKNVSILGNTIHQPEQIGINLPENLEGVVVSGNTLYSCGHDSNNSYPCVNLGTAAAAKTVRYVTISGNVIRNPAASPRPQYGILVRKDCDYITVVNNYVSQIWNEAILISGGAGQTNQSVICSGNVVDHSQVDAVLLAYITDATVQGNIVKNGGGAGGGYSGFVINNCTGVMASGNRCLDDDGTTTMSYGIALTGTNDNITLSENDLSGVVTGPFLASGSPTNIHMFPKQGRGTDITAAATIAIPTDGDVFHVVGNTNVTNGITVNPWDNGRRVVLIFEGTPTVSDTGTSKLAGNFVAAGTTADFDTLTLACDGTNWYEMARSVN